MKWSIGIDIGSVSTKGVLYNGQVWHSEVISTGWSPSQAGKEVLERLLLTHGLTRDQIQIVVGTGYGRIQEGMFDKTFSEITCHARGSSYLLPEACGFIDIGGQDSKVVALAKTGKVRDFVLNDKCAAGTGRFLQVTAQTMGLEVSQLSDLAREANSVAINSMCAVFAESEVIGLLAQGISKSCIIAGLLQSIAKRIGVMAGKLNFQGCIIFCGGVAQNQVLKGLLSKEIGCKLFVPPKPQSIGALGAAILGYDLIKEEE
ncbi:MAG: 2-hydroxyglutaryl-CoA dehydratase [Peptococcaceae bacterium]|nr:2-hydroxyglutaryl-CoA dehydratase [Peptococcaceae bacterium]